MIYRSLEMRGGMAIGEITDVEVKKAIAECKALGHDAFLLKYGFGDATA